jgi:hypothetical protein
VVQIVNPALLPALVAGFTGMLIALWIFGRRPDETQHRAVAVFLWSVSFGWAVSYGLSAIETAAGPILAPRYKTAYFAWSLGLIAYLWLISTLQSPYARPLARRSVRWAYTVVLAGVAIVCGTTSILQSSLLGITVMRMFDFAWMCIVLLGIIIAISAWRSAPPGLTRRKNGLFAVAFIVHDASLVLFLGAWVILSPIFPALLPFLGPWYAAIPGIATLLFQMLLLYGILSTQLFDIDLKIRWGLSRGTIGAIFVAAFFAASETVAALLSPAIGVVAGIMATALLIVVLSPLRRASDALAGMLIRGAQDTPAYRLHRKELVYQAQVEELMADLVVSVKERRALLRLQETLGLDATVATRLERDVVDRLVRPAADLQPTELGE